MIQAMLLRRFFWGVAFCAPLGAICSAQTQPSTPPPVNPPEQHSFIVRLADYYKEDWHPTAPAGPAPSRRGLDQPLDSPPFPNVDWSYGGSPTIGEADTNSYPLMTAINGARSRTKVYGWIAPSVDGSTSSQRNSPEVDDIYPNRLELSQVVVYVERLPDTVQREHVDFGYHLTALYGTDYRFTANKGYFDSQLVGHDRQYGFDPALEYVDVYLPKVAMGMNLRVGRFISIPGIEAQLTPFNYVYSHSLLYSVDPFTDTGALATIQLTTQWLVQAGVSASHDVAPWTSDAKPSFMGCMSYTTKTVDDNFYLCANGINDGKYAYNNLQQYDATWYHRFSKKWHTASEAYVMYQRDVPRPEWAIQNYINRQLTGHDYLSFRSDFLNDKKGQRTGVNTKYTENTLSYNHWVGSTVQIRPEIRFDHAWDRKAYDRGTKQSQFTVATDVVFHF
jgi:hypothetical protein